MSVKPDQYQAQEFADTLTMLTGKTWEVEPDNSDRVGRYVRCDETHERIWMSLRDGRLSAMGDLPKRNRQYYGPGIGGWDTYKTSIAPERGAQALARQYVGRVRAEYRIALEEVEKVNASHDAYVASVGSFIDTLTAIPGVKRSNPRDPESNDLDIGSALRDGKAWGDARVSPDGITLVNVRVLRDKAEAVLRLLMED